MVVSMFVFRCSVFGKMPKNELQKIEHQKRTSNIEYNGDRQKYLHAT
jgi:hypothetical protein